MDQGKKKRNGTPNDDNEKDNVIIFLKKRGIFITMIYRSYILYNGVLRISEKFLQE